MGSLSVLAQTYATMERVIQVPKSAFYPPPRVESTVIKLTRRSDADLAAFFEGVRAEKYFSIIHAGFASPRKQLRNTLRAVEKDEARLLEALKKAEVDGSTRPERLTIEDWARLARTLHRER
jgi:16S rRNA (adenine1518-N6/adenine1519-N6)-dimethyltransferase